MMTSLRLLALVFAALIGAAGGALAQFPPPGEPNFPPPGETRLPSMPQGPRAAPPSGEPPCFREFAPLRDDAAKKASFIKAASDRRAPPSEACALFKTFVAAEAKVLKFAIDNSASCGIPADAVKQMKSNHNRSQELRTRICKVAESPGGGRQPGPSLSDALGSGRPVATPEGIKPGRGTFDTLTGTPLGGAR